MLQQFFIVCCYYKIIEIISIVVVEIVVIVTTTMTTHIDGIKYRLRYRLFIKPIVGSVYLKGLHFVFNTTKKVSFAKYISHLLKNIIFLDSFTILNNF